MTNEELQKFAADVPGLTIRRATIADLDEVKALEDSTFPPAEAASAESFAYRLKSFPERFLLGEMDGRVVAMVNGCTTDLPAIVDELFEPQGHDPNGRNQMIFGLATHPDHQKRGVAACLMRAIIALAREEGRKSVALTCKERLIHYYAKFGYENQGVSASVHGGAVWYDMVLPLE